MQGKVDKSNERQEQPKKNDVSGVSWGVQFGQNILNAALCNVDKKLYPRCNFCGTSECNSYHSIMFDFDIVFILIVDEDHLKEGIKIFILTRKG